MQMPATRRETRQSGQIQRPDMPGHENDEHADARGQMLSAEVADVVSPIEHPAQHQVNVVESRSGRRQELAHMAVDPSVATAMNAMIPA